MKLGVVIPTFNRLKNLKFLFKSLEYQDYKNFFVVVADDGSTDKTAEFLNRLIKTSFWSDRLLYLSCGRHESVRTGRARNIGVANLPRDITHMIMLDSDLYLDTACFSNFATAFRIRSELIIFGKVDWLPPLRQSTIENTIEKEGYNGLNNFVPKNSAERIKGTFVGPELRNHSLFTNDVTSPSYKFNASWALPLNSGMPIETFWRAGGYDEKMHGYGYQDIEFGVRLSRQSPNLYCLFYKPIHGLHIWHPKKRGNMHENQRNLDYVLRKHGRNAANEVDVDWSIWLHFHRDRGGRVVIYKNSHWAIDADNIRCLKLPSASWITHLGYCITDVEKITFEDISKLKNMGIAKQIINTSPSINYR